MDGKNKYLCNSNAESDAYDYSIMPEQKSTTCSVRTGQAKNKIESNETTVSLSILVSMITMSYCVLKNCKF